VKHIKGYAVTMMRLQTVYNMKLASKTRVHLQIYREIIPSRSGTQMGFLIILNHARLANNLMTVLVYHTSIAVLLFVALRNVYQMASMMLAAIGLSCL
jgi:hypothetical protein